MPQNPIKPVNLPTMEDYLLEQSRPSLAEYNKVKLELNKLQESAKQRYIDGFTEGYNMAIEDIREGNPLNKVANSNKP